MTAALIKDLPAYCRLMRIDRPVGMLLLLWPTLWALWLAGSGEPEPTVALILVAGTWVMRAAGCIINDYADRKLDPHVARTRNRPLADGSLSTTKAAVLCLLLLLAAFWLVMQLNLLSIYLAIAALLVVIVYPFTKRFTHLPQLVLGIAFSMGIPIAYAALTGELPRECWLLFAANFLWIVAYDTYYAMADIEDDLMIGIKSTAILFGKADRAIILALQCASLAILALVGYSRSIDWYFFAGLLGAAGMVTYQQAITRAREPARCHAAFLNNNWYGAMVYGGILLGLIEA